MSEPVTELCGMTSATADSFAPLGTTRVHEQELQPVEVESFLGTPAVIGSQGMRNVFRVAKQVAVSNLSVLVAGESGTGKELVARAIHHCSSRSRQPWIDINCGALPEHLFESELFGYEKGAFSGADNTKPGLLELANTGTLFLDEIGDLSAGTQVKLLRVLDGAPYFRLGGTRKIHVDVRIVAATNQDLQAAIASGKFRLDLFHRLAQMYIAIPPLRERPEGIIPLAEYFLKLHNRNLVFAPDAIRYLQQQAWPGNVRQLRNVVQRAAVLCEGGVIQQKDLWSEVSSKIENTAKCPTGQNAPFNTDYSSISIAPSESDFRLDRIERTAIFAALEKTNGNRTQAADLLGISLKTLGRKLKSYSETEATDFGSRSEGIHLERRRQLRKKASGTTLLRMEGDPTASEHIATLCDVSNSGFRAVHDYFPLAPGDELITDGALGRQRAKVVWTRIDGTRVESGFMFLQPLERTLT